MRGKYNAMAGAKPNGSGNMWNGSQQPAYNMQQTGYNMQQGYGMAPQGYGMPQGYGAPQGYGMQQGMGSGGMPQQGYGMAPQGYGMPQQGYGMPQGYGMQQGMGSGGMQQGYGMPQQYPGAMPMQKGGSSGGQQMGSGGYQQQGSGAGYPSIKKIAFHVPKESKEKYATLYSIIAAVDAMVTENIEGNVSQAEIDEILPSYNETYQKIKKALNLTDDQVKTFCDSVNLSAGYAFNAFNEMNEGKKPKQKKEGLTRSEFVQIGTQFTTLNDFIECGTINASDFNNRFKSIVTLMKKGDFLIENSEAADIVKTTSEMLDSIPQNQPIDEETRKQLSYNINTLYGLFNASL